MVFNPHLRKCVAQEIWQIVDHQQADQSDQEAMLRASYDFDRTRDESHNHNQTSPERCSIVSQEDLI